MNRKLAILGVVAVLVAILAAASLFTVHQTRQAIVLRFGEPVNVIREPGLKAKVPFIENVVYLDRRVLDFDPPAEPVILGDTKRLEVDTFARYRIVDPLLFYQTVGDEVTAVARLNTVLTSAIRRVLGNVTILAVLSEERAGIMNEIRSQVNQQAQRFGIEIVDVRIRRADLPEETSQSVYNRMQSEREREAAELRARGFEIGQQVTAGADRERTVILAEAQRDSEVLRGEGDREAIRIYADAFERDPEFYSFYRSLEAYRNALDAGTTLVLPPNGEFFRYFGMQPAEDGTTPATAPADGTRPVASGQ